MHSIQRKILIKLLYAETLSYAQIRPEGVESNHFAYHLDQLVRTHFVTKEDKRYSLSPQGLSFVDRMSQAKMVDRLQPQTVTAINITDKQGRTLLFKRYFQPYIYRVGLPLGKTHLEESVMAAAERELEEKTGLTGIPLTHRGMAYIEATLDGYTISKVLYHLFSGSIDEAPPTLPPNHRGESFWLDDSKYTDDALMPGYRRIKQLLHDHPNDLFFEEITQELTQNAAA